MCESDNISVCVCHASSTTGITPVHTPVIPWCVVYYY